MLVVLVLFAVLFSQRVAEMLEDGIPIDGRTVPMKTFESDIPFVLRFMIDTVCCTDRSCLSSVVFVGSSSLSPFFGLMVERLTPCALGSGWR